MVQATSLRPSMVKLFQISLINSQYKLIGLYVLLTLFRYLTTTAQSILIGFSHLKYTVFVLQPLCQPYLPRQMQYEEDVFQQIRKMKT